MSLDFENPFADYGNIVRGERFIGRHESIRVIENRVINPREPGNLAIIGEPRIGKSSLVYKSIMERKEKLIERKLIPIWFNLGNYDQSKIFFRSLVTQCYDELTDLQLLTDSIKKAADRALEDELTWGEGYSRIQRFFERIRQQDIRILIILDEFDNARNLFKGDISGFQGLRELAYRPEWRVAYITTSRRTIREIELQTHAISTFDGIFHKHYLAMFNDKDIEEYFSRLLSVGIEPTSGLKEKIDFYCGGHPFLLEMLGYEVVEVFREQKEVDIDKSAKNISQSFIDQYDRMIDLLREDGYLGKLLQILFGPVFDVKQTDIDRFLWYGLIKLIEEQYLAFSRHFQIYLQIIERQVDLWPLWKQTETTLRQVITAVLLDKYKGNWIEKLYKNYPNLQKIFDRCREAQQKEEKSFGSMASRNLIDFTYPLDLFNIISAEWKTFEPVFGKDQNYWNQRFTLLSKIRNPLAHNREYVLQEYERRTAEGYCEEILTTLEKWNKPLM